MTTKTSLPLLLKVRRIIHVLAILVASNATRPALAEDWGAYSIIPSSAPAFVLEAVGSGTGEGTVVSIGIPAGTANQKWIITSSGNNLYS
jgi:gluconolactonase